jgi:hypothetical protein
VTRWWLLALSLTVSFSAIASPQHEVFSQYLNHIVKGSSVDYRLAKSDHRLTGYLKQLASQAVPTKRDEALAWWINAYNAHTLRRVLLYYPNLVSVSTVQPKFEFFDTVDANVGGQLYSLNQIEHRIIRKQFKDYRIHAALNCASVSCPPLQNFAFEGSSLDGQLDQVFKAFLNDRLRNPGRREDHLVISSLFKWYLVDFGGVDGLRNIWNRAVPGSSNATIQYSPYDWALNDVKVNVKASQ